MSWADDAAILRTAAAWVELAWQAGRGRCKPSEADRIGRSVDLTVATVRELADEPNGMGPEMLALWQERMQETMLAGQRDPQSEAGLQIGNATWQATAIGNEVARRHGGGRRGARWGISYVRYGAGPWVYDTGPASRPDLEGMLAHLADCVRKVGVAQVELEAARTAASTRKGG